MKRCEWFAWTNDDDGLWSIVVWNENKSGYAVITVESLTLREPQKVAKNRKVNWKNQCKGFRKQNWEELLAELCLRRS